MNRKKIVSWLKVIIIVYGLIGIAFYYFQEMILFSPKAITAGEKYTFNMPFREVDLRYDETTNLNIVQFIPNDDTVRAGVVLYFHGNRENIGRYAKFSDNFTKKNYEVWMPDYPGYGKSTGTISEKLLYEEALQVYKLARTKFRPEQIIIYGKSMGTCMAAELASIRDCKRLILETPYYNMSSLIGHYLFMYPVNFLLKYKLPENEFVKKVVAPVTIFHGTEDELVPYNNALKLKMVMKPTDEFITIEKGTHRNLNDFELYHQKLDSLLSH